MAQNQLKKSVFIFISLAILFLSLRLLVLLTAVEKVSEPEEIYRGVIAQELLQGLKAPFWDYQADDYSGGSLVIGLCAAAFFKLLGPNLFALKMVPFFFSFATFGLLFFFMLKYFSEQSAILASFLFIFSPPAFTASSLYAMGYHTDSILFSMLMLTCLYGYLYGKQQKRLFLGFLGLVSGLAFSFTYITSATLVTCLAAWYVIDRRTFLSRHFFLFILTFAIGLSPFVGYNLTHSLKGMHFMTGLWFQHSNISLLKPFQLVAVTFPLNLCFESWGRISGAFFSYLYFGVAVFLIASLKPASLKGRALPILIYPMAFILLYSLGSFESEYDGTYLSARYLAPLQFFLLPLMALGLNAMKRKWVFFIPLLLLGLLGQKALLFQEAFGKAFQYQGYSYTQMNSPLAKILFPSDSKFQNMRGVLEKFDPKDRPFVYSAASNGFKAIPPERVKESISDTPIPYQPYLIESWAQQRGDVMDPMRFQAYLSEIPENEREYLCRPFFYQVFLINRYPASEYLQLIKDDFSCRRWLYTSAGELFNPLSELKDEKRIRQWTENGSEEEVAWLYRGIGQSAGGIWVWSRITLGEILSLISHEMPVKSQPDFYWGLGWAVRAGFPNDSSRALDWVRRLPVPVQGWALEGFHFYESCYRL